MIPDVAEDRMLRCRRLAERIAFAHFSAVNIGTASRFASLGITPREFFSKDPGTVSSITGVRSKVVAAIRSEKEWKTALDEVEFIESNGISPVWYTDDDYPSLLRECQDAPAMLYRLGEAPKAGCKTIAIVGTRHCTPYGLSFIDNLVADLASSLSNVVIVSGMAYGADIAAHRAAVKEGIPTGGVMAEGLNRIYPADHRSDAVRIVREGGFLLTRYLSSDPTHRGHFLERNKIVAGMADATVIVESDTHGGAMVTARLASEYHREVLALPGRISDTYSRGCNELIFSNTARMIRDAGDLLEAMCWVPDKRPGIQTSLMPDLSDSQVVLLQFLRDHPSVTINEIAVAMNLPVNEVSSRMFTLEMEGYVNALAGGRYMVIAPV